MQTRYFIGVDGGGTHCRTRLTNQNGDVLAACTGGPANIWSQFDNAMKQVCQLLDETLHAAGLSTCDAGQTHVVLGLAGGIFLVYARRRKPGPTRMLHGRYFLMSKLPALARTMGNRARY
ncbi:BadF/BadG/BcrA/BcrD ATPase family protein [Mangrovibacter sp. SLW1]